MFLTPDEVSWQEILTALTRLSNQHEMMVVNDVIAFYPPAARSAMRQYARLYSIDWLLVMHHYLKFDEMQKRCEQQHEAILRLRNRVQQQADKLSELQSNLHEAPERHR